VLVFASNFVFTWVIPIACACASENQASDNTCVFNVFTLGKFGNEGFTLKARQIFSVHTTPGKLKTRPSQVILDLCLTKTGAGK